MGDRLRLLWVTPYLPRRGFSAAREYWWSLLARLARRHDITLLAFVDPEDEGAQGELPEGLTAVYQVAKTPWRPDDPLALLPRTVAGGFSNPAFADAIAQRLAADRYDLVQYEFIEMAHLIPKVAVPTILTVHQVAFAGERPMWRQQGRGVRRGAIALHRYLRELDFELRAVQRAHHVITVSSEDAARLLRFCPGLRISVSPLGVDCTHFRPPAEPAARETELLFVGNFDHPPNPDAVKFLVRDVLPRIGRPTRVRVVGRGVTPEVTSLARPGTVEVVGPVADVRPHLARAAISVAPVRFGTGMRGKVLEALAMARPVVTTSVGAEGLGAVSGRHLLVADDADAFAHAIRCLLDDERLARDLGAAGRSFVTTHFGWDAVAAGHETIYERVVRDPGMTPPWRGAPAPTRSEAIPRPGRWPAIAVGTGMLAARALRWHVAALRRRPRVGTGLRFSSASGNSPV
jgi:glycosyltransferase involved in cell wall biosynthesis